ncbi:MAG: VWA domain-containing protein [Phycisphaerales bacterium]|nr:VWA domain-containing protein [Phycisphaerales bacterium]
MSWGKSLRRICARPSRRRGIVAVQVGVALVMIAGFAALTIDVGAMYNAKADLQRTADAAALAAASKLSDYTNPTASPQDLARAEALKYTNRNNVFGQENEEMTLDTADVEFGRAVYNEGSGSYDFVPNDSFPDAVRVRVRMNEQSSNRALTLYFARVFGRETKDLEAEAIAMMVPRDIAIVADMSGSHTDDSELAHYNSMAEGSGVNLFDVWDNFPGGVGDIDSSWNGDEFSVRGGGPSPQMAGPAWGAMKDLGFGNTTVGPNYQPSYDLGLVRLPQYQDWSNTKIETYLANQGYIPEEIDVIMSSAHDGDGAWDERVAVALGLAKWNSGIPGGLWEQQGLSPSQAGNGNDWIGGSEITWQETFGDRTMNQSAAIWQDYINNYMSKTWTQMYHANSDFRYRFGIKTFINYLMERRPRHSETPEFANTPTQPMQAVKDAVGQLVDTITGLETDDHLSLEAYDTGAYHEVNLTEDYESVRTRMNEMQAAHYDVWTNMGGGILRAREELTGPRARGTARKVMILLTDGNANVSANGVTGDNNGGRAYAEAQAAQAVSDGIRIFSVSVGVAADVDLMDLIAGMGSGTHFHAEGAIDTYSAQLEAIFQSLGGARPVELIR